MIQLFDTHRLPYRNAKLRAWREIARTQRLDFYTWEAAKWSDIGNTVRTDEAGYLFDAGGHAQLLSLAVPETAIVEASLDNGQSWPIQWIVAGTDTAPEEYVRVSDIKTLTYYDEEGQTRTYSPVDANAALPNYALKSDTMPGYWAEEELLLTDTDIGTQAMLTDYTKVIRMNITNSGLITLKYPGGTSLRAGQTVIVITNHTINVGTPVNYSPVQLDSNELLLLCADTYRVISTQ